MFETFHHWSWSQLTTYRTCPYQAYLRYLVHSPQPPRDAKDAAERGIRVHQSSEDFLNKGTALCKELMPLEELYVSLIDAREAGAKVTAEKRDYFDKNWNVCEKGDHWLVVIKDISVSGPMNLTIDLKTGRKFGNEVKHFEQTRLYSITEWCIDPNYDEYKAELWYADQVDVSEHTFVGEQLEHARSMLDFEVQHMMKDKIFQPRPSKAACKYCPFSPRGTGACPVGV